MGGESEFGVAHVTHLVLVNVGDVAEENGVDCDDEDVEEPGRDDVGDEEAEDKADDWTVDHVFLTNAERGNVGNDQVVEEACRDANAEFANGYDGVGHDGYRREETGVLDDEAKHLAARLGEGVALDGRVDVGVVRDDFEDGLETSEEALDDAVDGKAHVGRNVGG